MPDEILITLEVIPGSKKYPLKIKAEDEELLREATAQLRKKFITYKQTFSNADLSDKDLLAMVAIDIASSHLRLEQENDTELYNTKIQQFDNELKTYLKEER